MAWRRSRRVIDDLTYEAEQARAERQRLRERVERLCESVDLLEAIARASGIPLDAAGKSLPPDLAAAARSHHEQVVRLDVRGQEVIAVLGSEEGDPAEMWRAIKRETGLAS